MEITEILHQFERTTGEFARAAVEEAVARREEIIPELLRVLEDTTDRAAEIAKEPGYNAHLYAMFLLGQFRETRAYPLVLRFALLPSDVLDALCGEFVTGDLGRVLASVCGGDLEGIRSLIENQEADQFARGVALRSLVSLVNVGQVSRDEVVSYFGELFRGKLEQEPSVVWDELVSQTCDLYPEELLDRIEWAYEEDLIDSTLVSLDDVRRQMAMGKDETLARLATQIDRRLVEDTVAEMGWWPCFHEDWVDPFYSAVLPAPKVNLKPPGSMLTTPAERSIPAAPPQAQFKRTEPKTGRNDPCLAGAARNSRSAAALEPTGSHAPGERLWGE